MDNTESYVYDSYKKTKATKRYNQTPQKKATKLYQYIHTDLVDTIMPIDFR